MLQRRQHRHSAQVLVAWQSWAERARGQRELGEQVSARASELRAARAVKLWRRGTNAACFRTAVLLVRSMTAWCDALRRKRGQRERLAAAVHSISRSMLIRVLRAWKQHAFSMGLKRAAFARKQRAVRSALAVGAQLRKTRHRRLLSTALLAWTSFVAQRVRLAAFQQWRRSLCVQWAWGEWAGALALGRREVAAAIWHAQTQQRTVLATWSACTACAARAAEGCWDQACAHHSHRVLGCSLRAWRRAAAQGTARRLRVHSLLRSTRTVMERRCDELALPHAFHHWVGCAQSRAIRLDLALVKAGERQNAALAAAFSSWLAYTRAMQQELDMASPFLQPRSAAQDQLAYYELASAAGMVTHRSSSPLRSPRRAADGPRVLMHTVASSTVSSAAGGSSTQSSASVGTGSASWGWSVYDDEDVRSPRCITPVLGQRTGSD